MDSEIKTYINQNHVTTIYIAEFKFRQIRYRSWKIHWRMTKTLWRKRFGENARKHTTEFEILLPKIGELEIFTWQYFFWKAYTSLLTVDFTDGSWFDALGKLIRFLFAFKLPIRSVFCLCLSNSRIWLPCSKFILFHMMNLIHKYILPINLITKS